MNRPPRQLWLWASAALAAGLLLRLWFVHHMAHFDGDSLVYGDIARNWLQHGVYGFTEGGPTPGSIAVRPTLIRLPGYPLFLAACFRVFGMEHYNAVLYMQLAADLLTCCAAAALAGRLFGARAALAVLWLAAICPFTANYVAAPLTETLTLTTIALAFYGFARWQDAGLGYNRWLWVVAAALAWSILLRPEQVLLAIAVLPAMLWRSLATRASVRPLAAASPIVVAALLIVLPLVPWTARNWHTFHVFQPLVPRYANDPGELPPTGFGRWYRTWAIDFASTDEVYWNYTGYRIELADLPPRVFNAGATDLHAVTTRLLADYDATVGVSAEVNPAIDARFAALADQRIGAHPVLYYAALPVARLLDMALRPRTEMMPIPDEWWRWRTYRRQAAFSAAYAALNLAYITLGCIGFLLWKRSGWQSSHSLGSAPRASRELAFALIACVLLRALLLLTIDNSEPRYTLEFFPVVFVFAGALFAGHQSQSQHRTAVGDSRR